MAQRPVYIDVYTEMLRDIQTGLYPENSLFPPEEKLCRKYNASRSTLRRALNMLKETGVLYSVQGNGTYIKPFIFTQPLSDFYSFTDTLKSSNILIQNSVIHYDLVKADKSLAIETGYQEGTVFHKLLRLRSARTYPLMLETTFLPQSRFLTLDTEALSCGSLYEFLREQYNFHADRATEKFRPVMPRSEERTLLHISSNVPCTLLERYSYEGNVLIEYTKSIVRGDKYAFRIELANNSVIPLPEQRER